jgi:predicted amidophosphoribosyltransferase
MEGVLLIYIPKDPRTHFSVDPPSIFKEPQDTSEESPWRLCRQCAHPFSRMNDVCPKCGKNQEDPIEKSLEEIRAEAPEIIDNFIKRLNDAISARNKKPRR